MNAYWVELLSAIAFLSDLILISMHVQFHKMSLKSSYDEISYLIQNFSDIPRKIVGA